MDIVIEVIDLSERMPGLRASEREIPETQIHEWIGDVIGSYVS